jgi:hypothetical protein
MDNMETYRIPQTRPPSPYHETTWDLKLDRVNDLLRHTKEKKIGYLELYYQGFMEFVNDGQELPEISDDDEEYPRWGSFGSARDKSSTSSATSVASRDDLCPSVTSDTPVICHTPERMGKLDPSLKHMFMCTNPRSITRTRQGTLRRSVTNGGRS